MRRFLRVRLFLVLFALILAPAAVLPFAERVRSEWANFWEPEAEVSNEEAIELLYLPPGEWCGTFPSSVEDPIVIEDGMTETGASTESIDFDEAIPAIELPPLVVEP